MNNLNEFNYILYFLNTTLPHSNWYIAGSSASKEVYNDIDIYFLTEEDFLSALESFKDLDNKIMCPLFSTSHAHTFMCDIPNDMTKSSQTIQLVCKNFGTPSYITSKFDLNKSRKWVTPDGTTHEHSTYKDKLYIDISNAKSNTPARYLKYYFEKGYPLDDSDLYSFIDYFLTDGYTELLPAYTEDSPITKQHALGKAIYRYETDLSTNHPNILQYYRTQLAELYPELLI